MLDVPRVIRGGCVVEQHRYTLAAARERFDRRPAHVCLLLDSVPVHDPEGLLEELVRAAVAREKTYRMPTGEVDLKRYWWQKVRSKLSSALERGDTLLAGFLASTSAAEIVSDLFAVEGRPPPPVGATAFARLAELRPTEDVSALFEGGSVERAEAAARLLDRILRELPERSDTTGVTWSTGPSRAKERCGRGATLLGRSALPAEFMQGGGGDALFGRVQVLQPAAPQRVRHL